MYFRLVASYAFHMKSDLGLKCISLHRFPILNELAMFVLACRHWLPVGSKYVIEIVLGLAHALVYTL